MMFNNVSFSFCFVFKLHLLNFDFDSPFFADLVPIMPIYNDVVTLPDNNGLNEMTYFYDMVFQ